MWELKGPQQRQYLPLARLSQKPGQARLQPGEEQRDFWEHTGKRDKGSRDSSVFWGTDRGLWLQSKSFMIKQPWPRRGLAPNSPSFLGLSCSFEIGLSAVYLRLDACSSTLPVVGSVTPPDRRPAKSIVENGTCDRDLFPILGCLSGEVLVFLGLNLA